MFEPSPSRGKVAPPKAVTDEGETNVPPPLSSDMLNKILEAFYLSEPDSDENS